MYHSYLSLVVRGARVAYMRLYVFLFNSDGYVGLAVRKGKEVSSTIRKAIDKAKLNLIPVIN